MIYARCRQMCLIFCTLLGGCTLPVASSMESGEGFNIEHIRTVNLTDIDKTALLKILGPPLAVSKQNGTPMYIPILPGKASKQLKSNAFLELFISEHDIGDHSIVYYYQHVTVGSVHTRTVKLWVLIDERTQKVVDYKIGTSHD